MNTAQRALLEAIQHFKDPNLTDLEACLNLIDNHASTIQGLRAQLARTRSQLRVLMSEIDDCLEFKPVTKGDTT